MNDNKIKSDVYVEVKDNNSVVYNTNGGMLVGKDMLGPKSQPILIGPSIPPILWYQFWRYHQIKRYKREVAESIKKIKEIYGEL